MELFETQYSDSSFLFPGDNIKCPMHQKQTDTEDQVRLVPIMGIRPGVYLTVLYSIILLAVLFFLLVFPGLRKPGSVLTVKTEPAGAAIRIDGVYMGVSGGKIQVKKGTHAIEAVLPDFETESVLREIPGRVFGSLFFPLKYNIEFTLTTRDPAAAFAQYAADFAAWSFGGEPTVAWQIPLILSEGAYRTGPANDPQAGEILAAASRFTVTRAALRDLVRAKILVETGGLSPSPTGLIGSISDILVFLSENSGSAAWLSGLLPRESAYVIEESAWYKSDSAGNAAAIAPYSGDFGARRFEIDGLSFIPINSFMISENFVQRSLFETFLNENPQWKDGYIDFHEELSVYPEIYDREVITGVTWFAAEAFCRWLTLRLPPSMANMEVRLPTEAEWEYAPRADIRRIPGPGLEWCADYFAPLQFIKASPQAVQAVGSPERSIRGRPSSAASETRASLPPELSSPFVTFRPVVVERAGEK
jgi:hypothetical protein